MSLPAEPQPENHEVKHQESTQSMDTGDVILDTKSFQIDFNSLKPDSAQPAEEHKRIATKFSSESEDEVLSTKNLPPTVLNPPMPKTKLKKFSSDSDEQPLPSKLAATPNFSSSDEEIALPPVSKHAPPPKLFNLSSEDDEIKPQKDEEPLEEAPKQEEEEDLPKASSKSIKFSLTDEQRSQMAKSCIPRSIRSSGSGASSRRARSEVERIDDTLSELGINPEEIDIDVRENARKIYAEMLDKKFRERIEKKGEDAAISTREIADLYDLPRQKLIEMNEELAEQLSERKNVLDQLNEKRRKLIEEKQKYLK